MWFDLAKEFVSKGHQVRLLCRKSKGLPIREVVEGVKVIRHTAYNAPSHLAFAFFKDFLYSLRTLRHLKRGDVVVTNSVMLPIVISVLGKHAGQYFININRTPKGQMRLYQYLPIKGFAAASNQIKKCVFREAPRLEKKTFVVHNPVDLSVFSPPKPNQVERHTRRAGEKKLMLYTGRIHPEKGLEALIQSFGLLAKDFSSLHLRLQGPWSVKDGGGGEAYKSKLQKLAENTLAPVDLKRFEIADPVYDRLAFAKTLREADFYCYPTVAEKGEALPIAPLEAMATGLVPITTNLPVFDDYITPNETGLFVDYQNPERYVDIANHVRKLMNDEDLHYQLRCQAFERAQEFSTGSIADQFLELFSNSSK